MSFFAKLKTRYGKLLIAGMVCGLAGFVVGIHAEGTKKMIVTPFQEAKFVPTDPANPDGPQMAVLWGDPAKGPSAMLLKFKKGSNSLHIHTSDYHLVLVQGSMKHWEEGEQEADAKELGPGSYWFQPGNQAHAGSCLTDECIMFVKWEGMRDGRVAEIKSK
ncbi:cupin domain-containing protein [bacterium]|nr:cupin domain-containing protein [bacterium]